jgi:hypothetical protein
MSVGPNSKEPDFVREMRQGHGEGRVKMEAGLECYSHKPRNTRDCQ